VHPLGRLKPPELPQRQPSDLLTCIYDGRRAGVGGTLAAVSQPTAVSGNAFNADNGMTAFNGQTLGYDANGNLLSDGTNTYTWDARNHLTGIGGANTASFVYDAFGRRMSKTINGTVTQFVYDRLNPLQELDGSNAVTATLLTGLRPDEYFARTDSSGTPVFLTDALGSTVRLGSTSYTYQPFGATTVVGSNANSYQFTGRENDATGLYYYRARYYSPTFQRFIGQDPIGFRGGDTNLYGYAANQPTGLIDPLGLTYGTNIEFLWNFLTGGGQTNRSYGPGDVETQEMMASPAAAAMRSQFQSNGCQSQTGLGYGTGQAAEDTLLNPGEWSSTALQVGGFAGASVINNGNGTATFTIPNDAGAHSFLYHLAPNREGDTGPMRTIQQTFQWTEPITGSGCGCH
jgi:RHS repeat-associated protein